MASERLRKLVVDIAKENDYGNPEIAINPINTSGANYTSALFTIIVSESDKEDLNLFAKVINVNEAIRSQLPEGIFDIERLAYEDLLKKYEDIEIAQNLPSSKRFVIPKYYGCNPKLFKEIIVLENLTEKGFTTYDRFKSIDWEYAAKAVETLAKYHALSMAYKEKHPEEFKQFTDNLKFQREMFTGVLRQLFVQRTATALAVTSEKYKSKLERYLKTEMTIDAVIKLSESPQLPVLCHGDYRPSNLMHRYNEDGSLDTSRQSTGITIPVDFQTLQYGCPISDLLYFIFTGSDEKFRRQYFQDLTDHYYQELNSALRALELNPDVIYPKRAFELDLKEFLPFGLIIAIFSLPIVTVEVEDAPSMQADSSLEKVAKAKTGSSYPERMNGVINDFFRWGIIE